jgi:pilus assembly protein CpaF
MRRNNNQDFADMLSQVQEYLSTQHSDHLRLLRSADREERISAYIERFLVDRYSNIKGDDLQGLVHRLYFEVAEFSLLSEYLKDPEVEEIDINRWDDVKITYADGKTHPASEIFLSPKHALDVVKRLLHASHMVIDEGKPLVRGHLERNIRITAFCEPVVDKGMGVSCSIRMVNPKKLARGEFISNGTATREMLDFLSDVIASGLSICLAGATTSGKTTLLGYLLSQVPDNKRIVTIENEVREFDLVKTDDEGNVLNNVIHLITKNYDKAEDSIDQDRLLEYSLTMNPDVIVVGEAKSGEAMAAQEAARTGHAVLTTIHARSCSAVYYRLVTLCLQKASGLDEDVIYNLVTDAFPITVYLERNSDTGERKITEIAECEVLAGGERRMHSLWQGSFRNKKPFEKCGGISGALADHMKKSRIPDRRIENYVKGAK